MRDLGVGLIWSPALAPLCEAGGPVDVVEFEPQTTWEKVGDGPLRHHRPDLEALEQVAALPQPALLHGIGQPFGGLVDDPVPHLDLLRATVEALDPPWVSEHLSLNRVAVGSEVHETGFLLPPRQIPAGAQRAAEAVRRYGEALGRPVAFETGVNYFRPRPDELPDGEYFARVADTADSGILLDLHNLWCNQRNGRAAIDDVLARLPLERVWEVHLAGGDGLDGVHLDAHRGGVDPELLEIAAAVVPRLPNLGALLYEVLPEHLAEIGIDGVARQLDALHALWTVRPPRSSTVPVSASPALELRPSDLDDLTAWERAVADVASGRRPGPPFADLSDDPGAPVYRRLVTEFRQAALARCLRHTTTALLLGLGSDGARFLIDDCHRAGPPDPYAAVEAERTARELVRRQAVWGHLPHVAEVLAFEHALLRAALFQERSRVRWTAAPDAVLTALAAGRWPTDVRAVDAVLEIAG